MRLNEGKIQWETFNTMSISGMYLYLKSKFHCNSTEIKNAVNSQRHLLVTFDICTTFLKKKQHTLNLEP